MALSVLRLRCGATSAVHSQAPVLGDSDALTTSRTGGVVRPPGATLGAVKAAGSAAAAVVELGGHGSPLVVDEGEYQGEDATEGQEQDQPCS